MTNIIFLDIDGVMNCELFYLARNKYKWFKFNTYWWRIAKWSKYIYHGFKHKAVSLVGYKLPKRFWTFKYTYNRLREETDPIKWKLLIGLCKETNSKICISSTWKHHFKSPLNEWEQAFIKLGFPKHTFVGITGDREKLRGTEIKNWIKEVNPNNQSYDNYIIIDDDADMLLEQGDHFFQTDPYVGLTPTVCYKIKLYIEKGIRPKLY